MKKRNTKHSFTKFTKRNTHKRTSREKARRELLKIVDEVGVSADHVKISIKNDGGRRARETKRTGKGEISLRGVFSSSKSGFGFVTPLENEENKRDIFIPEDKTMGAVEGDLVEIIYHEYKTRFGEVKTEGRVKKIVEYGRKTVIGTLVYERGYHRHSQKRLVLLPDDPKFLLYPIVTDRNGSNEGDKVELLLNRSKAQLSGEVIYNFGKADSKSANYEAILREYEIPIEFTPDELAEAERLSGIPITTDGRVDRREEVIFTIDGEGAKDLDDAISLRKIKGGYKLGVHIADVSYYVREKTALDRAVMSRGTSVYFTDKVVPMLPPALSNGACSLNCGEDKYTLSAIITLNENGDIIKTKIEPSVIRSRVRGVYSEVNAIFDGTATKEIKAKYKSVIPTLNKMHDLYLVLKEKSRKRGALELETSEAEILLDKNGEPTDIIKRERGDGEKLIEQFMLTANEGVATLLHTLKIPCVYRIHENPPEDKLDVFLTLAHNLGFDTSYISRDKATAGDFSRLLVEAEKRGISTPVSYSLLRSMSKARYSDIKSAHFGLGIESYCHFTSPIRRLSDLATHRIIHRVLLEGKIPTMYQGYARRASASATESEIRALGAERRIENLYKVIYMQKYLGCEFDAVISSVTSFGFFAELSNTCEGLVPISDLVGVFTFDEKNLTLRSRYKTYKLGDVVRVRLEEADIIRGKLRFSVV